MTHAEIDQAIYNTAIEQGFNPKSAKFIVAQARFETGTPSGGDYSSKVFKANNNTGGIKYIGASQINAQRGSLAPADERTCGGGCNGDYYAKFDTIQDSINDKIVRLYNKTMRGVTPQQLKDSTDITEFATLLKKRGYYGPSAFGTAGAQAEINNYVGGMKAKLFKINVLEFYTKNKTTVNLGVVGLILIGLTGYFYFLKKKKVV
jgi:LPXTG-motif cell wall-anchored protein